MLLQSALIPKRIRWHKVVVVPPDQPIADVLRPKNSAENGLNVAKNFAKFGKLLAILRRSVVSVLKASMQPSADRPGEENSSYWSNWTPKNSDADRPQKMLEKS